MSTFHMVCLFAVWCRAASKTDLLNSIMSWPCGAEIEYTTYARIRSMRAFGIEIETANCRHYTVLEGGLWGCKSDGSISGMEFISPPMRGDIGAQLIEELCDFAHQHNWRVNQRCGLHVHLDMRTESSAGILSIMAAFVILQPAIYKLIAKCRINNRYCHSVQWRLSDLPHPLRLMEFVYGQTRYMWLNCYALHRHNTLEIRLHQGSLNAKEIINWVRALLALTDWAVQFSVTELIDKYGASDPNDSTETFILLRKILIDMGCMDLINYYEKKARKQ